DGCTEDEAKRFLYKRWELAKQELANTRTAKFVNLAVFDYVFEDKPTRRPIVTLAWKDWKKEPEIAFPASVTPIQPSQERVFERPRVVGITPTDSGSDAGFDAGPDAGPDAGSDAVDAATTEAAATTQAPDAPADTADTTDAADAVPNETRDASTADSTADSDASVEQPTAEEKPVGPFAKETRPSLPRTMGAPSQSAFAPSAFAQKQNLRVKDQQRPPEPFPLAGAAPPKTETRPSVEQTSATATPTQPFEPARDLDAIEAKSPTADSLDQNAPAPRMSSPRLSSPQFSSPRLSSPQWSQPKIAQIKTAETKTAETKTADTNMPEPRVSRPSITMSKREPFAPAKSPSNFAAKSPARPDGSPQPEQRTTRPDTATPKREPAPIAGQTGGPGPRVYRPSVTGVSAVATKREPASQATSTESTPEPAMDPTMEPKPRLSQTMPAARTVPTSRTLPSMTLSRAMPATGSATGSQDANAAKTTQQPSPRVSRLGPLTSNRETSAPKKPQVIEPRPRASVAPLPTRREPTLGVNRASTASLEARPRPSTIGQFSPQRKGHAVPGNQANSAADDANSDADNSANNESRDSSAGDNT
ncbi:MAG: hypothetical protein FWD57_07885, partial [Polyangiaceae bacterium]|nr:hypothetical protein [Polyangiaceae bacterium]